jgi:hypothetical protein
MKKVPHPAMPARTTTSAARSALRDFNRFNIYVDSVKTQTA